MRAVDTNLLVRLLSRDDEVQAGAAEEFVSSGAWISHLVLVETTWVLESVYQLDHRAIATAVEMLLVHRDLALQDPDVVRAALNHYRSRSSLGFSDCMIVEIARKAGHLPLGTFDKNLARVPSAERL
ncbi:MAG: type II toxin-antitoxin system VapC family toxin [Nitrospirae bacterium]|nr:type II toxin-antitoxin system VapC family toxin [Nitrospirota bacterium]